MTATTTRRPVVLVLDSYAGDATRAVRRQGAEPITVNPRDIDAVEKALAADWDALLLTGGGDVDPRLYGEKPHRQVYGVNETRDYTEWNALDEALARGAAVLGICRGSQLMAVHNGGRLKQHITGHRNTRHLVLSERGTRFRRNVGNAAIYTSLHHQIVLRTGSAWRVAARNPEGMIEAVESRDGRCLGVQFHPEMDHERNPSSRAIFRWLVVEAARRADLPKPKVRRPRKAKPKAKAPAKPTAAPAPKNRKAGQLTLPRTSNGAMSTFWVCRDCGMQFDRREDRDDHEDLFHTPADELYARIIEAPRERARRAQEPPPGHPDWM